MKKLLIMRSSTLHRPASCSSWGSARHTGSAGTAGSTDPAAGCSGSTVGLHTAAAHMFGCSAALATSTSSAEDSLAVVGNLAEGNLAEGNLVAVDNYPAVDTHSD